ncbi:MAG: ribosome maturation factor RimP [Proteobacteria bacterium]|nr:MAG: ribosome maturation factor RimP [Pseudomonadota bacterium]
MDENTLKELIKNEGANFYDTELVKENDHQIYRIFITSKDGVSLDLCAKISNIISPLLDLNPPTKGQYFLEVSSPGLERKLKKPNHFINSLGELARIDLVSTEKIEGKIISADENQVSIQEDDEILSINYDDIHRAKTFVKW